MIVGYCFDMIGAFQGGAKAHPQLEIRKWFPDAHDFEANSIADCWYFNAAQRDDAPGYFSRLDEPFVTSESRHKTRQHFEGVAREMSTRVVVLSDRLCAAFSRAHRRIGITSRKDERDRQCQYPVDEEWCGSIPPISAERVAALVAEYEAGCDIPPEECMVVAWIDGTLARVGYARKPERWA